MILSLLLSSAFALPPDGLGALLQVGSGKLGSVEISSDGDVITGTDGGDKAAWLLHVEDWSLHSIAPCSVRASTYISYDDGTGEVWVACDDGLLRGKFWDPTVGELSDVTDADGNVLTADLGEPADGLWFSASNGYIYAISPQNSAPPVLHAVESYSLAVDGVGAYPVQMQTHSGFNEGVLLFDDNTLVVSHGGQQMSTVGLYSGTVVPSVAQGSVISPVDMYPAWSGVGAYGVASSGTLAEFNNGLWTFLLTGLDDPKGVIANLDPADPWIAVTGGDVRVWQLDPDTGAIQGSVDQPYFVSIPDPELSENFIQDGATSDGYLWGAGVAGYLHVATARPWVSPTAVSVLPAAATAGDTVVVTAQLDEPGDWEIRRGGDRERGGELLDSGTLAEAGSVSVELTVDTTWDEGSNPVYVFLQDDQNLWGHARGEIVIDNPPDPPVLKPSDLGFGDRTLILDFAGIDDADLLEYQIYVTTTPFEPSDFETDGPAYDGNTNLTTPLVVAGEPSAQVTVDINPLKNDVKHYVAVRAVDQGGQVGPMSNAISQTPRPAYSAAELAGEEGGPRCATTPGGAGWLAILLAGVAGLRRRVGTAVPVAALALAPAVAHAQDNEKKGLEKDLTPQVGNFEARYGGIVLQDNVINDVYDQGQNNILQIEFGPQFGRIIEIDAGIGFFQELSFKVDSGGSKSSERTMLTWWPALSLDATARLHIVDEQIIVPYIRGGFDWVVWSEKWDQGGGKNVLRGDKFGNHFGLGGSLLLDVFDKKRASLLEATSGINDTYLTFEWRRQRVDDRDTPWAPAPNRAQGFDFSATMFTVGLKLDY